MQAPAQHRGHADLVLGGHSGQRRRFSGGGILLYLHRTGGLFLRGGNELQELTVAFRHQDGGQAHRKTVARGYFRPADEKGNNDQSKQIRVGAQR